MTGDRINILADKWLKRTISAAEKQELESWYASYESLEQQVNSDLDEEAFGNMLYDVIASRAGIEPALIPDNAKRVTIRTKLWPRIAVAAAVAVMTLGVWLYYASSINGRHPDAGQDPGRTQYANDIAPGKNGATITLGNGKVIALSDAKSGVVVGGEEGLVYNDGTEVGLLRSSREALGSSRNASSNDGQPNPSSLREPVPTSREGTTKQPLLEMTASTARGQTYQFTLPDGTKVWLNADSKIKFPSKFAGKERQVVLEGEGYFEVAKNRAKPFVVETAGGNGAAGQRVEVLGTHFNINAYKDEASIKTTLLEGSVRVSRPGGKRDDVVLKPDQQSILTNNNPIQVKQVDPAAAIDWKEGLFVVDNEPLERIMAKISRWYDVQIVDERGPAKPITFKGSFSRYDNVSKVLSKLEFTGDLKFKIQGRKIIITK